MDSRRDRYTRWALAVVIALGLGLRWYHIADRSIWFDEAFTWRMIQYPFCEMLRRIALDNSPPLHFVLLKYWAACFGDSLPALRSLSVVMGGVTILAMFLFVRAATASLARANIERRANDDRGSEVALFAAMFVAISAFQIRWSWDARPYALGAALALLSSWALLRALWSGEPSRRWWCLYAALTVLFAYTLYFALFTVAAQAGFVLYVLLRGAEGGARRLFRSPNARGAVLGFGLIGLCWLPWLPFFLRQMSQVRADFWIHPVQEWDLAHTMYWMFVEPENAALTVTASLWALDLCVLGWLSLLWRAGRDAVYVAACALTPIGLSILLDSFGVHLFLLRYLLFAHLFFLAGLAMLVNRIPLPIERRFMAGMITAWGLFAWFSFSEKADFAGHPGARAAAECIVREANPEEPVVVSSPFWYLPMLYHLRDRGHCYLYRGEGATPTTWALLSCDRRMLLAPKTLRDSQNRRLWFVDTTNDVGCARAIPVLNPSKARQEEYFPEVFGLGDIIVQQYVEPIRVPHS
jgi:hypothetical protein